MRPTHPFLRPGLFLMLDDLEAPQPTRFQWMLHAYDKMEIDRLRVVSRRKGAQLAVHLQSPVGLAMRQDDVFDPPYNADIPPEYHKDVPNQWHVAAETQKMVAATRIGAVMAVSEMGEKCVIELAQHPGWYGVCAQSGVEGWVQLEPGTPGSDGFGTAVRKGHAKLCGRAADGELFSV